MFTTVLQALRVYQWTKNLLVFAALVFAEQLFYPQQIWRSVIAFFAFCAASSTVYLINDIKDVEHDRIHPTKRMRPLASGALSMSSAIGLAILCAAIALMLGQSLGISFLLILLFYMALVISYSLVLKNILLVDVLVVAIGFVVRAIAGAIALDVVFSDWLVVCTLFLALFLGFSKRRHEIQILDRQAMSHREVLGHYTVPYLDSLILVVAGATLITYTIYTCSPEVVGRLGTDKLYLSLPFVVYGLFRYLYLVHIHEEVGDPSRILIKDRSLAIAVLLWGFVCMGIIYWKRVV